MDETIKKVGEFNKAFGIETPNVPSFHGLSKNISETLRSYGKRLKAMSVEMQTSCALNDSSALLMRMHLMTEELGELAIAISNGDIVESLDALCDLRYVNDGTCLTLGLQDFFLDGFREVHSSNMSKLEDGKPVKSECGRIKKGRFYRKPDLLKILNNLEAFNDVDS